ncbi:MAG: 6-hydroxymethylpterin diphosphokinase MptE-like protein [Alkalispirochaeta sp.]
MKREQITSRSGAITVRMAGVFLHSRYDPQREANRHVDTLGLSERNPRAIVVVGEGIPYLSAAIAERYPNLPVLAVVIGPVSHDHYVSHIDATALNAGDVRHWLRRQLSSLDAAALELVTWEPGRRAAPHVVAGAEQEVLEVVRDASSEIATIGSFGRRWLTNAIRSAILIDSRWDLPPSQPAATLATSGPSLERLLPDGRAAFPGMLTATSSAWSTLARHGIAPDIVVHTDGGFWAARYLSSPAGADQSSSPPLAITSHAAIPDTLLRSSHRQPFSFLATGGLGDQLHPDHSEWLPVFEAPTVTVTAIHMLHRISPDSHIYLAGVDLASRGLRGHARPHPNDRLLATWAHRLRPELSIRAERTIGPEAVPYQWEDGVVGFRSRALEMFRPELERAITRHRSSGTVASLGAAAELAVGDPRSSGDPSTPPPGAYRSPRKIPRPSRHTRTSHVQHVLHQWRERTVEGTWDAAQREMLLYLAPVELLQVLRGELDQKRVVGAAHAMLDDMHRVADWISHA